jgi:transcription factor SPN1
VSDLNISLITQMDIDTATLKECRLGPIVDFYTKTKRVPPSISRAANQLYDTWYRLVTGRSASLRQKPVRDVDVDDEPLAERGERVRTVKKFNAEQATQENKGRKGAALPRTTVSAYLIGSMAKGGSQSDLHGTPLLQLDAYPDAVPNDGFHGNCLISGRSH